MCSPSFYFLLVLNDSKQNPKTQGRVEENGIFPGVTHTHTSSPRHRTVHFAADLLMQPSGASLGRVCLMRFGRMMMMVCLVCRAARRIITTRKERRKNGSQPEEISPLGSGLEAVIWALCALRKQRIITQFRIRMRSRTGASDQPQREADNAMHCAPTTTAGAKRTIAKQKKNRK